jgi:hypothetical protein
MNFLFNLTNSFFIASPLDQFGTDADFTGLLDNIVTDFIPLANFLDDFISFIGLTEIDSLAD